MGYLRFCGVVTLIATVISALVLVVTLASANGAPQEAAGAALAVALSVIPYVHTRMVQISLQTEPERRAAGTPSA